MFVLSFFFHETKSTAEYGIILFLCFYLFVARFFMRQKVQNMEYFMRQQKGNFFPSFPITCQSHPRIYISETNELISAQGRDSRSNDMSAGRSSNSVGTDRAGKMSELRYVLDVCCTMSRFGMHNWSFIGCASIRSRLGGDAGIGVIGLCERDFDRGWIAAGDAPCHNHHVLDHSERRQLLIIPQGWE